MDNEEFEKKREKIVKRIKKYHIRTW